MSVPDVNADAVRQAAVLRPDDGAGGEVGDVVGAHLEPAHAILDESGGVVGELLVELVVHAKLHQLAIGLAFQHDFGGQHAIAGPVSVAVEFVAQDQPVLLIENHDRMVDLVDRLAEPRQLLAQFPDLALLLADAAVAAFRVADGKCGRDTQQTLTRPHRSKMAGQSHAWGAAISGEAKCDLGRIVDGHRFPQPRRIIGAYQTRQQGADHRYLYQPQQRREPRIGGNNSTSLMGDQGGRLVQQFKPMVGPHGPRHRVRFLALRASYARYFAKWFRVPNSSNAAGACLRRGPQVAADPRCVRRAGVFVGRPHYRSSLPCRTSWIAPRPRDRAAAWVRGSDG